MQESMHLTHTIRHPVSAPTLLTPPFPTPPLLFDLSAPPSLIDCCLFCLVVSNLKNVSDICHVFYQVPSHLEHSVDLVVSCPRLNVYKIKPGKVSSSGVAKLHVILCGICSLTKGKISCFRLQDCCRTKQIMVLTAVRGKLVKIK